MTMLMRDGKGCGALAGMACAHGLGRPVASVGGAGSSVDVPFGVWLLVGVAGVVVVLALLSPVLLARVPRVWWTVWGYPVAVVRLRWTWHRLTDLQDLSVTRRPTLRVLGDVMVKGKAVRTVAPRAGVARRRPGGLVVRVRLHPGQVPEMYAPAAGAMAHAWRMHAVRVASLERGWVTLTATAWDPLSVPWVPRSVLPDRLLRAVVGRWEDGSVWVVDLRVSPHWLIVGATRSGKSTLMAALVAQWSKQHVALVGIDLKGGMELSLFESRLSALATTRAQAADLLGQVLEIALDRMALCRSLGARSIWELPDIGRPVPVIVLVDEVAELYLMAAGTDRTEKAEVGQVSTALLRLGQLGAALGVHLVVAGQRVGSDLGTGVTALRAQLAGRVCHRVTDKGTAEMALGDLDPEAVAAAQVISIEQAGVAVAFTDAGGWMRARSVLVTPEQARAVAQKYAARTPVLSGLGWAGQHTQEGQ